jgi:hypothetical protein
MIYQTKWTEREMVYPNIWNQAKTW